MSTVPAVFQTSFVGTIWDWMGRAPVCREASGFQVSAGQVTHRGDPVWVFTSDYQTPDGLPCRFQMQGGTNSRRDYGVADTDAVYFEKGLMIFVGTKPVAIGVGPGVVKIPDTYAVETIYQDGYLGLFYETGFFQELGLIEALPHQVPPGDVMSRIWTLARGAIWPHA